MKERSITEGWAFPSKGNLVYSSGGLRRTKPPSTTFSKYGVEEPISPDENDRDESERGLCMLRFPTTRRGTPSAQKRVAGETE